jgi:hypothetical protein
MASLFDDLDPPEPLQVVSQPTTRSLLVRAGPATRLTKAQRAFNRLVSKVETLRARLAADESRFDAALTFHAQELQPRQLRVAALRRDLVRALRPFLLDRRLKRGQKQQLRDTLAEQLDQILRYGDSLDDDLGELFEELHGVDLKTLADEQMGVEMADLAAMFDDMGIDIDLSGIHADMSPEELAVKQAELAAELRKQAGDGAARAASERPRRKTRREAQAEARAQQHVESWKASAGTVYRQLAKVLHPDLESDPQLRDRKSRVMQELTAAYAANDLHTLLRLELEWIHHEGADAERLTDAKLTAYAELLHEQVAELESALEALPIHPKYAPLQDESGPFGAYLRLDGAGQAQRLDDVIGAIGDALVHLQSDHAFTASRPGVTPGRDALVAPPARRADGAPESPETRRDRRPAAAVVEDRLAAVVRGQVGAILGAQAFDPHLVGLDGAMRQHDQRLFDRPHVLRRQPPVIGAHHRPQVGDAVAADPAGQVDVGIDIAQGQVAQPAEQRLAAMQPGVTRARDRAPAARAAIDEDHVIELVDRLEAHHERRVAALLENGCRRQRRFHAVRHAVPDDAAEAALRGAALFGVVGQGVQPRLHRRGRAERVDNSSLGGREREIGRREVACGVASTVWYTPAVH